MSSPKQLARIAGVFYLLVGIFGGFAEGFVDPKLHAAGNAAATAANVAANAELVRMGVVAASPRRPACAFGPDYRAADLRRTASQCHKILWRLARCAAKRSRSADNRPIQMVR